MSTSAFRDALSFTLRWEGGYVNHPNDPGGATNRGITQATYDSWRLRMGWPKRSVRDITVSEVEKIYEAMYWNAASCSQYGDLLGLAAFDFAVNSGPRRAVRFLQATVGAREDGVWGPKSAALLRAAIDANGGGHIGTSAVLASYVSRREGFVRELARRRPKSRTFLEGWLNRLTDLRKRTGITLAKAE